MHLLLRSSGIILCAVALLGNTQCQQSNNQTNGSPAFVTRMSVENASGNATTNFSPGQTIQFVLSVRNRSDIPQTITVQICAPSFQVAVVKAGTSYVVFDGPTPGVQCQAISLNGVPLTFAAGETKTFTVSWNQSDSAGQLMSQGNYEVMGGITCWDPSTVSYDTVNCMPLTALTPSELTPTQFRSDLVAFTIQ